MSAKFPAETPTLYADKNTGNDVGDSRHWDGRDANDLKAEVIAVATKVGVDEDVNEDSHDFKIRELESRSRVSAGSETLASGTETVVSEEAVGATSQIIVQGTNAGFGGLTPTPYVSAVGEGSFTLTHGTAAGTETFFYLVIN